MKYKFKNQNKGFTLIEMIVTITVLSIVLGLTVSGMISWQDWANFKKENEYAQTLFVAAQNQLAEYSADGRLKELQESFAESEEDYVVGTNYYSKVGTNLTDNIASLIGEDGNGYDLKKIFPNSADKTDATLYQDEIVSLRAQTGDYQKYLDNPKEMKKNNPEAYWLFELLGAYVYDTSILNGSKSYGGGSGVAICVEMTPGNGQVFSVLYSDKNDGFIYAGIDDHVAEGLTVANINNRTEQYREKNMVGYYGVDTLYTSTSNAMVRPSVASVKLYNKDTFYMTFKLSTKFMPLTSELDYVMDLDGSQNVNDKKISITLPAKDESGVPTLKNALNAQSVDCKVSRYHEEEDGKRVEDEIGTFPVLAWVEADNTVHVVWDAADVQATTDLYEAELSDIRSTDKADTTKFSKTYSFFRFGVDADNVYASVTAKGDGYTSSRVASNFGNINIFKNQMPKHTCFANESDAAADEGKIDFTYTINNARHLYNMRYIEDLSYLKEAGSVEAAEKINSVTFRMKDDVDWAQFERDGQFYDTKGTVNVATLSNLLADAQGNLLDNVTTENCSFPSISQIRERDAFDGNGKTITGLATSEIANALYGIYFDETRENLYNLRPTAFVNVNYGTIEDLTMDQVRAVGSNMVGGVCAINAGEVAKLKTLNTDNQSLIAGKKNVGGIIGFQMPTKETLVVENLENNAQVEGTEAVGGILGMVRNEFSNVDVSELTGLSAATKQLMQNASQLNIQVKDCENYGPIAGIASKDLVGVYVPQGSGNPLDGSLQAAPPADADRYEARYIGGIVGYSYNVDTDTKRMRIEDCVSAPQYDPQVLASILKDDESLSEKLVGAYVGGIVGYNHYGEINECSTKPDKGKTGYLFGYRYVGGIVGFNIGPSSGVLGSNTSLQGVNESHVIAYEYAGGITGCNASVQKEDSYGNDISADNLKDPEKLQGLMIPDIKRNLQVKVDNWVNKAIVIATNAYAGGISGYNTGWIYRCNSIVESSTVEEFFSKLHSGNYAGGVAGYNNGIIGNTERNQETGKKISKDGSGKKFSTTCYVRGRDYIGGIVGYNDVDAIVEDYQVSAGYVIGDEGSHFVGGYAGFNSSVDLLMDLESTKARSIFSNPNQVKGTYFVGGNVGGNVINTKNMKGVSAPDATKEDSAQNHYDMDASENQLGVYWGVSTNSSDISFSASHVKSKDHGAKGQEYDYTYTIKNNSSEPYKHWRLEIELPDDAEAKEFSDNVTHQEKNQVIALFSKTDSVIYPGESETIVIRVHFSTGKDRNTYTKSEPRLSFCNVLYHGKTPANTGDPDDSVKRILAVFRSDNFLGTMKGKAFVGGFVGYNLMIENDDVAEAKDDPTLRLTYQIQEKLIAKFAESDDSNKSDNEKLKEKIDYLEDVEATTGLKFTYSPKGIYMTGENEDTTRSAFGTITSDVFVGGVMGYNDPNTKMDIVNVENASAVVALKAIQNSDEQVINKKERTTNYLGKDYTYKYSYAGGMVGKAYDKTTLNNCKNLSTGTVNTKGTYTGGLCEINEGVIKLCHVSSLGSGVDDYLGGLCGLNEEHGIVENCYYENKTVSGRNVVGGIAAENFGTIKNIQLNNAKLNASGLASGSRDGVAGLYVGFNGDTGVIELEKDLEKVSVKSDGRYVGAVAGVNAGLVENQKTNNNALDQNLKISGNVEGYYAVGALFGLNRDTDKTHSVLNYTNVATVIATNGNAGGIIGENASSNAIQYCVNDAVVSATSGDAGGITSYNLGEIVDCYDHKSVSAPKGTCGGITAVNGSKDAVDAIIHNCYVTPDEGFFAEKIKFISAQAVGGIAATNYGVIEDNVLQHITVTDAGDLSKVSIGAVVGDNAITGRVYLKNETDSIIDCSVLEQANNCNTGGVAGTNDGLITEKDTYAKYQASGKVANPVYGSVNVQIGLDGASYGSLGGIAGLNTGTIAFCQVDAKITGNLGTSANGYGGIAGYTGYTSKVLYEKAVALHTETKDYHARIIGCTFDGSLHADGSAGNPANVGGMTGINGYGGYITDCKLGVRKQDFAGEDANETSITSGDITKTVASPDKTAYAYLGGIAGRNYADIDAIDMRSTAADHYLDNINIIGFGGVAGGMAGFQYEGGNVLGYAEKDASGKVIAEHWSVTPDTMLVEMRRGENDYGIGGLIGYDKSVDPISYLKNYAHVINYVTVNVKTGGIVGTIQSDTPKIYADHLENYGLVEGDRQVGGLIGRTKFCTLEIKDSKNYGEVIANNGTASGLIASIYDVKNTDARFTNCENHGFVHTIIAGSSNRAAGMLGNFDSSRNFKAYFYKCINTGIVQNDQKTSPADNVPVGDFVGVECAPSVKSGEPIPEFYFDMCQSYNTSSTSNGFAGNLGAIGVAHLANCLDNSGRTTVKPMASPFLGIKSLNGNNIFASAVAGKSTLQNVYYLSKDSKENAGPAYVKDNGAYFTLARSKNYEFLWRGTKLQKDDANANSTNNNNPAGYFSAPTKNNLIQMGNNSITELHVQYDDKVCTGMKAFNFYFCSNATDGTLKTINSVYKVTTTFTDEEGNSKDVVESLPKITDILKDNKISCKVPEGLSNRIVDIKFTINSSAGGSIYSRGFTYDAIKADGSVKETLLSYLGDKYDKAFHMRLVGASGNKINFTPSTWHSTSGNQNDDVGSMKLEENEQLIFQRVNVDTQMELTIEVNDGPNATGMDAFVFYPSTNGISKTTAVQNVRTYYYDMDITFTDKAGNSVTEEHRYENGTAIEGWDITTDKYNQPVVCKVPEGVDKNNLDTIKINFVKSMYQTTDVKNVTKTTDNQTQFYMHGFGWIPSGCDEVEYMPFGVRPSYTEVDLEKSYGIRQLFCDYENNGGTANAPYVYTDHDYNIGFLMDANDPVADEYYEDKTDYVTSDAKEDGSNSRIKVYEDLQDEFFKIMEKQYAVEKKLATPTPTAVDATGSYKVTWPMVKGALEYELKYKVENEKGTTVFESDIETVGSSARSYLITSDPAWAGCKLTFYVRAVNGCRYRDNVSESPYDSDWGSCHVMAKEVLPEPRVHIELTSGNRMVAILDNADQYALDETSRKDCIINVDYGVDKPTMTFHINVAKSLVSEEAIYINENKIGSDYMIDAKAVPSENTVDWYSESSVYYLRGHIMENQLLTTMQSYIADTQLRGFYGNQADQMTYNIYYNVPSGRDCYLRADLVAYDKDLGMDVSYSNMLTHAAASSAGAQFTSTLSNLPEKLFAEDFNENIIVREYVETSQYDIVHYGHTVAKNLTLSDKTEVDELKALKDEQYLVPGEVGAYDENHPVWDAQNKCFMPGYTLQLKHDEDGNKLYDLVYNASIELAMKAAAEQNKTATQNYIYYNYCVNYKVYEAEKDTVAFTNADTTSVTKDKIVAKHNLDDYQETYLARNQKDKTHTQTALPTKVTNSNVQELQPAPIIDNTYKETSENQHRAFTFTFDEYYKDRYSMTVNNTKPANTYYSSNAVNYLTQADDTVATTWDIFKSKSGYDNLLDGVIKKTSTNMTADQSRMQSIMNAYYYTYNGAQYRVDLLGTTLEGEKAVIASQTVTSPTRLEDMTNAYKVGTTNVSTVYERYNYQAKFVDENDSWNNYSDFTVRVMRIGGTNGITYGTSVGTNPTAGGISKITSSNSSTYRLPRYSEHKIHVKLKLNSVNNPKVGLHQDENGFVTDDLLYDVSFGAITNEKQLKDLGGYLICAKVKTAADESKVEEPHYYYVTELDKDAQSDEIGELIDQLKADGKSVTEIQPEDYTVDGDSRMAILDFSDFNTNDTVEVTVQALARKEAESYSDSDVGNGTEIQIHERLKTPDVNKLTVDETKGMDVTAETIDTKTYAKGIYVKYDERDENYVGDEYANVKLNMAIALYNAKQADETGKNNSGDGLVGSWNAGAVQTLYTKKEAFDYGNVQAGTPVTIDLNKLEEYPGEFAGKWLKIALKATSVTKINSQWTDQDPADDATVNYKWIHIPNLQLDDVTFEVEDDTDDNKVYDAVRYYDTVKHKLLDESKNTAVEIPIASETLHFAEDRNHTGYRMTVVTMPNEDDKQFAYDLFLEQHMDRKTGEFDGTWNVFIKGGNSETSVDNAKDFVEDLKDKYDDFNDDGASPKWKIPKSEQDEDAIYIGNIGQSILDKDQDISEMIEIADISKSFRINSDDCDIMAQLCYEPGKKVGENGTFQFVMPDITKIADNEMGDFKDNIALEQVWIQPFLKDSVTAYELGDGAIFKRTKDGSRWPYKIEAMTADDVKDWLKDNKDLYKDPEEPETPADSEDPAGGDSGDDNNENGGQQDNQDPPAGDETDPPANN